MTREAIPQRAVHSKRAQWAWLRVAKIHEHGGTLSKEYATHVRKLPARIQVNGLGQALAFLFSKRKNSKGEVTGAGRLLLHLGERIADTVESIRRAPATPDALMAMIVEMSPDAYRRATHELMTTSGWMKRFVDGLFDKEEE